ncbi:microviridin/marinostatin family tricyclic proteinase inhibitor [Brasilonema sp. CT11]|nr:microviridin/marinostatin family tricyclic proteinase inhibitor [Brasilonema sp. CT11]
MSDNDQQTSNDKAVPFFARYLEGQSCEDLSEEEMENIHGGYGKTSAPAKDGIVMTMKYPSDNEDGTKKAPSDSDEAMTQKYPSDGDEQNNAIDRYR